MPIQTIVLRTIILYFTLLVMMRIMGKRELGQLSPFDFVVSILIAELAAIPMEDDRIPIINGIVPIVTLVVLQIGMSYLIMQSETLRKLVNGRPSVLIKNGEIQFPEMRKNRCDINDLITHLRSKNIFDVADVEFAVLEPSGELSIIVKSQKRPLTPEDLGIATEYEGLPTPLIIDGVIHQKNLQQINLDERWLYKELEKKGVYSERDVLFASINTKGEMYVAKKE